MTQLRITCVADR